MSTCVQRLSVNVEEPATCVEWCPHPNYQNFLICGTYQLIKGDGEGLDQRRGRLTSFQDNLEFRVAQQLDVGPGILDAKWLPCAPGDRSSLGAVDSKGRLELYSMESDGRLVHCIGKAICIDGSMLLSLDVSSSPRHGEQPFIATSDSDGRLSLLQLRQEEVHQMDVWKAHDFEAWTVNFDRWNPSIIYSGGDDSRCKGWDMRQTPETPTFVSKQHSMGVTSIQSNDLKEHVLATGSYDERLLLWDTRNMRSVLGEVGLGGGIWRIKWDPWQGRYALAACMHGGAVAIDCDTRQAPRQIVRHSKHDSMVYGIDWCRIQSDDKRRATVASCSFYDKAMHLWTFELTHRDDVLHASTYK